MRPARSTASVAEYFGTPTEADRELSPRRFRGMFDGGSNGRAGDDLAPEHGARRRTNARNRVVILPPEGHGARWAGAPEAHR